MRVVADNKKRIALRSAKPGDKFDVRLVSDGKYLLTKLEPIQSKAPENVRIEKRGQYYVGVLGKLINEKEIRKAIAGFP